MGSCRNLLESVALETVALEMDLVALALEMDLVALALEMDSVLHHRHNPGGLS